MNLYQIAGDLATDLRLAGWSRAVLKCVCEAEAKRLTVSPVELLRKVEAAYTARVLQD